MSIMIMNYDNYNESLKNTPGPIDSNNPIFKVKIDLKGLRAYAKSVNKSVHELSDEEKDPYVEGGMKRLKEIRGF